MIYDRKVPALLQSKQPVTDSMSLTVKREFIVGYVLEKNWPIFGPNQSILVSAEEVENGDGRFMKVKVIPYGD